MKQIHYINIGMPKSGTSWLFNRLLDHPDVDFDRREFKENNFFLDNSDNFDLYADPYRDYNVSMNFPTHYYLLADPYGSEKLPTLRAMIGSASHVSITFRNPYDFIQSYYNFCLDKKTIDPAVTPREFIGHLSHSTALWYGRIYDIIQHQCHLQDKPFAAFYYDDLSEDYQNFYNSVTSFIGLRQFNVQNNKDNVTRYATEMDVSEHIGHINSHIRDLEFYSNKNLDHWKRK